MIIRLTRDTAVRFAGGSVVDVSEAEASRLMAFNNAVRVEEKKSESKKEETKPKKTKAKKDK